MAIWVVVDRLTNLATSIPTKSTMTTQDFSYEFANELFQCHGFPMDIVNDKDTKFTSDF